MGIKNDAASTDTTPDNNLQATVAASTRPPTQTIGGTPRLGRRVYGVARALWLVVFVIVIALVVIGTPAQYNALSGNDARYLEYTDAGIVPLGISRPVIALYDLVLDLLTIATCLVVGAILFFRRPRERMAYLASFMLITWGPLGTNDIVKELVATQSAYEVPYRFLSMLGGIGIILFAYTAPNGRFIPRWTRWVALFYSVFALVYTTGILKAVIGVQTSDSANFVVLFTSYAIGGFAQIYRLRHGTPVQSQQLKWIVAGLILALVGFVAVSLVHYVSPAFEQSGPPFTIYRIVLQTYLAFALSAVPVTIGISVFRYRLWEIDLAVNRGLVYGGVTVILASIFLVAVVILQAVFQQIFRQEQAGLAIAVATLGIGALFNPLRIRLQQIVDRKLYGIAIDFRQLKKRESLNTQPAPDTNAPRKFGSYAVSSLIGKGGMGEVWRGKHDALERPVAVKLLPGDSNDESGLRERFEREARTVATLRHPNIVQLYDFGQSDQDYYMVMEYIDGESLSAIIKRSGALPFNKAMQIIRQIAAALDHAHEQGIIHRDVKPSNIMIRHTGEAILMDFGIAKSNTEGGLTKAGGIVGTIHYMAPEQIMGAKDVDLRADIYSLGVVVFEMLTGQLPFSGDNPGVVLMGHLQRPVPDPRTIQPDLPASASAALLIALAKKPEERFARASDFANALEPHSQPTTETAKISG